MPKSRGKSAKGINDRQTVKANVFDISLNDFANSAATTNNSRVKKYFVNQVKQLSLTDHNVDCTGKRTSKSKKKTLKSGESVDDESFFFIPLKIWYMLGDHIKPEDVGRFAAICKSSLAVVSTASFWFNLYKKYYREVPDLPERFQPKCMVRRYGLIASVIRALHFMYPPFINKLKAQDIYGDPLILKNMICILSWFQKRKADYVFYFKMKQPTIVNHEYEYEESKPTLMEMLEDITANMDKNCKVLEVTCSNYVPIPMLSGHRLRSVSVSLGEGLRNRRLQLDFDCGTYHCMSCNFVVLDPVLNLRVLDWWHPSFPYTDGLRSTLYENENVCNCAFNEIDLDFDF